MLQLHRSRHYPWARLGVIVLLAMSCAILTGACDKKKHRSPTPSSTSSGTASVRLTNNSSQNVTTFNISPCGNSSWGPNQLGSTLTPGASTTITSIPAPGCYDFRAIRADSTQALMMGRSLSVGQTVSLSVN